MEHVSVRVEGGVATVQLDRPPVNAIDLQVIAEFHAVVDRLHGDREARAVVIAGADRMFSAGADLAMMRDLSPANHRDVRRWIDVQRGLEQLEQPVLAAIRGYALGGGAELSIACDLRYLGADSVIGFPEIRLGLFPGAGGTQRLRRLVGTAKAFRLITEGRRLRGEEALRWGVVDEVVDDADVVAAATDHARRLATGPTRAIGLVKRCLYDGDGRSLEEGLEIERRAVFELIESEDLRSGLEAFDTGTEPRFRGR